MELPPPVDVPCNGPCRKRFRPAAVNMATVKVLLSSGRKPELQWFCSECQHRTLDMRQIGSRNGFDLPPELWIIVFRFLDSRALLRVRATCHRWKNIVDQSRCLRNELRVTFERRIIMDERFQPENLLPASRASLREITLISVGAWWNQFGTDLTLLELMRCEIALHVLLRMLEQTPNLTRLILCNITYTSTYEIDLDFRLEKLDYLYSCRVFEIFGHIFPRLKKLELGYQKNDYEEAVACRFLHLVQGSLENLDCRLTPFMLEQMASMNRLRLKTVVHHGTPDLAVKLSEIQVSIEDFAVTCVTNEDLCQIGRNLTKLRKATITFKDAGPVVPSFLAEMPQLTTLHLEGVACEDLIFQRFTSANISNLRLDSFNFAGPSLRRFLTSCDKLQELEIRDCSLNSWSDIFAAQFNSLRCLKLRHIIVEENTMNIPEKLNNLRDLVIANCEISTEMLVELLLQGPQIGKLSLCSMKTVTDKSVAIFGQFPRLKKLELYSCAITDGAVELIADNCSHLAVHIGPGQISSAAMKLLSCVTHSR